MNLPRCTMAHNVENKEKPQDVPLEDFGTGDSFDMQREYRTPWI